MEHDYSKLLKRARDQLPERVFKDVRFKRPRANSFIQGNQTIVKNFKEIANKLGRDAQHLMKYLLRELATAGNLEDVRAVFQGKFSDADINRRLDAYIDEYVLCNECHRPDTRLIRQERQLVKKCDACSAHAPVRRL